MGEEGGADGEDHGHRPDHERGVRDGGDGQSVELQEELDGDAEEGGDEEGSPLAGVEAGFVGEENGKQDEGREEEAVEDHCTHVHFSEGDFAGRRSHNPRKRTWRARRRQSRAGGWVLEGIRETEFT